MLAPSEEMAAEGITGGPAEISWHYTVMAYLRMSVQWPALPRAAPQIALQPIPWDASPAWQVDQAWAANHSRMLACTSSSR